MGVSGYCKRVSVLPAGGVGTALDIETFFVSPKEGFKTIRMGFNAVQFTDSIAVTPSASRAETTDWMIGGNARCVYPPKGGY